jgi:hypothetical protein
MQYLDLTMIALSGYAGCIIDGLTRFLSKVFYIQCSCSFLFVYGTYRQARARSKPYKISPRLPV